MIETIELDALLEQARTAKVVTDKKVLRTSTESTDLSVDDAQRIAGIMLDRLDELNGVGLSAIQLGIPLPICVINVDDNPVWFLNPRIVGVTSEDVRYMESCLSLPGTMEKPIITRRSIGVHVESDNYDQTMKFQGDSSWPDAEHFWSDRNLLESVAVQHEIDHCNGKLITDRRWIKPVKSKKTPGRNDKVMFENVSTGETKFLKFKKGERLLSQGWKVV